MHSNPNPFDAPGRWLRCNFHAHSTASDGRWTPELLTERYRDDGYDVLCITDHNKLTPVEGLSDDKILVIPGEEMHPIRLTECGHHLVAINPREEVKASGLLPNHCVARAKAAGAEVVLAHPAWTGLRIEEVLSVEGIIGIEIWNTTARNFGRPVSAETWDLVNEIRGPIWGLAVDDIHAHDDRPSDYMGGWVWMKARERSIDAVLEALRAGQFYASCGPLIKTFRLESVVAEDEDGERGRAWQAVAETSPAAGITFVAGGALGRRFAASAGQTIGSAEIILKPKSRWVRLEVVDESGNKAWSNPLLVPQGGA